MRIPKSVKIGGLSYEVKQDDGLKDHGRWGEHWGGRVELHLAYDIPPQRAAQTLLHEVIEAINAENDMGLKHHQISVLEAQLYQVIIDNPEMFSDGS